MTRKDLLDWSCAELIHTYCELNAEEYAELWDKQKLSELEFVLLDFACFKDWAEAMGYEITHE